MIVIELGGRYWTGTGFSKRLERAMTFDTTDDAWEYADFVFPSDIAEECGLQGKAS